MNVWLTSSPNDNRSKLSALKLPNSCLQRRRSNIARLVTVAHWAVQRMFLLSRVDGFVLEWYVRVSSTNHLVPVLTVKSLTTQAIDCEEVLTP